MNSFPGKISKILISMNIHDVSKLQKKNFTFPITALFHFSLSMIYPTDFSEVRMRTKRFAATASLPEISS